MLSFKGTIAETGNEENKSLHEHMGKDRWVLGDCCFYIILLYGVKNANLILDLININTE